MPKPLLPFATWRRISLTTLLLLFPFAVPAQDAALSGKSTGPVVMLPRLAAQDGQFGLHLPGREYKAGSGWWALACPGRCELYPLSLGIKPQRHPVYDGDPVPGQLLSFTPPPPVGEVLVLFKPVRLKTELKLQPGPVATYYPGLIPHLRRPATPGTMEGEVGLPKGQQARLVPTLLLPENTGQPRWELEAQTPLALELHFDGRRQMLGTFNFGIEGVKALKPSDYLIWAGDLDGDGKPDFLINFDFQGTDQALFLSSLAQGDELVGEAGRFQYFPIDSAGC